MDHGVAYIFKTLIKVPCIIMVSFILFNLFMFTTTYFKMLGASYIVAQTAMENNYLPEKELKGIENYVGSFASENTGSGSYAGTIVTDIKVVTGESNTQVSAGVLGSPNVNNLADNKKKQYGTEMVVGVSYHYNWIWPLSVPESTNGTLGSGDLSKLSTGEFSTSANAKSAERAKSLLDAKNALGNGKNEKDIVIRYKIPGLQYYADMDE